MTKTPRQILAGHQLSEAGLTLLMLLVERGPLTLTQIANLTGFDQPFSSRLSAKLETGGWITRTRDPSDYRSKIASLAVPPERIRELAELIKTPDPAA